MHSGGCVPLLKKKKNVLSSGAEWDTFAVVSYLHQTYNRKCMEAYTYFVLIISLILVLIEGREDVVEYMVIKDRIEST